ncbi:MAG TPA: hypothetical protein VGK73_05260 [Polyangiaceae bacterium]
MSRLVRTLGLFGLLSSGATLDACKHEIDSSRLCASARSLGVTARLGSQVSKPRIQNGAPLDCGAAPSSFRSAVAALTRVPPSLRPSALVLHVDPALERGTPVPQRVEVHRATGELLVAGSPPAPSEGDGSLSVWLHELGHVRAHGVRPSSGAAERLLLAVDEAVADYFAAAVSGSPRVGIAGQELRDLSAPPAIGPSEWASLALPAAFDAHRFGWVLAAELFRTEPEAGALLEDLLAALASREPWPETALGPDNATRELVGRCSLRSRPALERALRRWLPPELYRG